MSADPRITRLERSAALWNRATPDLRSVETVAQILDQGDLADWRALDDLAREDAALRRRILQALRVAPIGMAHFWLAAMARRGEPVDFDAPLPAWDEGV